jgi:hypothetical protein
MKKRSMCGLTLVVTATFFVVASSAPAVAGHKPGCGKTFAEHAAGSYLMVLTVEIPDGPPAQIMALATLGADGTFSSEDQTDYGLMSPVGPAFESDNRGAWKRCGRRSVVVNSIGFTFGPADTPSLPAGTGRNYGRMHFNRGFTEFRARGVHDVFFPGQDPLDPDEEPAGSFPWTATGRRIPAVLK